MLKNFFIVVLSFSLISSNFVLPVHADQTENSVTEELITDIDEINYDPDLDLLDSYEEKGLMNLNVPILLNEKNDDYCQRFEQVAKSQNAFAVEIPYVCEDYFGQKIIGVDFFYPPETPRPYFVGSAFLVTGGAIVLGGILASTFLYNNSDTFVNSVYNTFNKLADNAKTNLSNLFNNNTAYNDIDTDFISGIHSNMSYDSSNSGYFTNPLGYRTDIFYNSIPFFVNNFSQDINKPHDHNYCNYRAEGNFFTSDFGSKGITLNSGYYAKGSRTHNSSANAYHRSSADFNKLCSIMNIEYKFSYYYSGNQTYMTIVPYVMYNKTSGYGIKVGGTSNISSSFTFSFYNSFGAYADPIDYMKSPPILNVDGVDFYKHGSVTIGKFPDSLLDYTTTDVKTGAITGVLRPPLTNTQTGEKVETVVPTTPPPTGGGGGTVPPPVLPEEDFDGWGFNIDFSPLFEVGEKFLNVFPFSLIRDFTQVLENFDAEPKTPIFEIPIFDGNSVTLDLSFGNGWASFFRSTFNFVYSALLAYYLFKRISL